MLIANTAEPMAKPDTRLDDQRWRRKRLFRQRGRRPIGRLLALLLVLALFATVVWWPQLLPSDLGIEQILP